MVKQTSVLSRLESLVWGEGVLGGVAAPAGVGPTPLGARGGIREATIMLAALPREQRTVASAFPTAGDACGLAAAVSGRGLSMRSLTLARDGGAWGLAPPLPR